MDTPASSLSALYRQIMWNRLIAVVEEQAKALMRTAFSTSVREAGDLSAGVFDRRGRMVAQAVTGTPGHVNSMANGVAHFLKKFPIDAMKPGDHFITNDPWLTSGHLHDFTVVTPTFVGGRAIALFACTIHVVDVGGRGFGPDGRQVYEEGLFVPIMHLAREGRMNEDLLEMLRVNVREKEQVLGDIFSCASSNEEGAKYLAAMMREYGIEDIEALSDYIVDSSRAALGARIRKLKPGTYKSRLTMDGYEKPIELRAALTVAGDRIVVDYAGTSPASQYGINVVLNYTQAYTAFGVNCILGGDVPNNYGSLSAVEVTAPEGCILNAAHPAPVAMRHCIGHALPDLVFGCLDQAMGLSADTGAVPAQSSASLWNPTFRGGEFAVDPAEVAGSRGNLRKFDVLSFHAGGMGARPAKDGLSATAFPSGVRTIAVEVTESISPVVFWRKELRQDTGGAGRQRGGLGHRLVVGTVDESPFSVLLTAERVDNPPKGLKGGGDGGAARVGLRSGKKLRTKGQQTVPAGDAVVLEIAGGGGYGDPLKRDPEKVADDVREELVSQRAARAVYGVALKRGAVDAKATEKLRAKLRGAKR
jgi:N-methylhydantoinase B